jgi:hypothetical protein
MPYTIRDLTIPSQKRELRFLLQSIFCAELLTPSYPLWISSGWISDIPVIDNSARQFQALYPDWDNRPIRFSEYLAALCSRGGRVVVVLRDESHNKRFIHTLTQSQAYRLKQLAVIITETQHVKGLVGERLMIGGSMNFTFNGIEINDEEVVYRCDPVSIHEKRLSLMEKWGQRLPWSTHG